jgi:hypothetical protein
VKTLHPDDVVRSVFKATDVAGFACPRKRSRALGLRSSAGTGLGWSAADGSEFLQPPIRASWAAQNTAREPAAPAGPEAGAGAEAAVLAFVLIVPTARALAVPLAYFCEPAPCLNPRPARSETCRILKASIMACTRASSLFRGSGTPELSRAILLRSPHHHCSS